MTKKFLINVVNITETTYEVEVCAETEEEANQKFLESPDDFEMFLISESDSGFQIEHTEAMDGHAWGDEDDESDDEE